MCDTITLEDVVKRIMERKRDTIMSGHEGAIWQGSNGYFYTYIYEDGVRKQVKRVSKEKLETYILEYYEKKREIPTLGDVFNEWIDWKLENEFIGMGTYNRYKVDFNKFLLPLEDCYISTITEDDLDIFIRKTIKEYSLTAKAYSNLRTVILGIFKYAKKKHYVEMSIGEFFSDFDISKKCFRHVRKAPEDNVFSDTEIKLLMPWLRMNISIENLGLIFAFQTGVRCGELAALKWNDISLDGLTLHVQRQEILYQIEPGKQAHEVVEYTKTEAGDRYIYLPTAAVSTLHCARSLNNESEFIFAKNGRRINKTVYNTKLATACRAVGIPERTMHKIRKTYATKLIESDVEDIFITDQLGHSSIETTRKYYYFTRASKNDKTSKINSAITF